MQHELVRYVGMKIKVTRIAAVLFSLFILTIIYLADTGGSIVFAKWFRFLPYPDKWGHFLLFGILTLLLNLAFQYKKKGVLGQSIYLGALVVSIFAILEELSQGFIPTRSLDGFDLLADGLGIGLFSWVSSLGDKE